MIILLKYISLFIYPLQFSRNSESLAIDSLQFPLSFSGLGGGNKEGAEGGGGGRCGGTYFSGIMVRFMFP